jgi:hypothetical protein
MVTAGGNGDGALSTVGIAQAHPGVAAIVGARRNTLRLGGEKLRAPRREPRFGLRHVGARHLAHIETIARLLELLGQNFDVAPTAIIQLAMRELPRERIVMKGSK